MVGVEKKADVQWRLFTLLRERMESEDVLIGSLLAGSYSADAASSRLQELATSTLLAAREPWQSMLSSKRGNALHRLPAYQVMSYLLLAAAQITAAANLVYGGQAIVGGEATASGRVDDELVDVLDSLVLRQPPQAAAAATAVPSF